MPSSYTHTLRITFAHDGPKLEITNVQRVAMRAPAALPPAGDNQAGYWLEVRDSKGALLYHRPIHDPLRQHVESFGEAAGAPTQRLADAGGEGASVVFRILGASSGAVRKMASVNRRS